MAIRTHVTVQRHLLVIASPVDVPPTRRSTPLQIPATAAHRSLETALHVVAQNTRRSTAARTLVTAMLLLLAMEPPVAALPIPRSTVLAILATALRPSLAIALHAVAPFIRLSTPT